MAIEVLTLDHIYIAVSDFGRSTIFYDGVMQLLGFRKGTQPIGGEPHVHYFNRALQLTLRPANPNGAVHDKHAPGLHHICFQLPDRNAVNNAAIGLQKLGVSIREPRVYPQYSDDYYAIYFNDPDGIELELVNRTRVRNLIVDYWDQLNEFENPLRKAGLI